MLEFFEGSAPFFGNVRWKYPAFQAEMRASQQIEFCAYQLDIAEEALDLSLHGRNKLGNRAVIGTASALPFAAGTTNVWCSASKY